MSGGQEWFPPRFGQGLVSYGRFRTGSSGGREIGLGRDMAELAIRMGMERVLMPMIGREDADYAEQIQDQGAEKEPPDPA